MDPQQFLNDAPLGVLFGLLIVPLCGALFLGGYLVFALSRRSKKSKLKLGLQANDDAVDLAGPLPAQRLASPPPPDPLDLGVLGRAAAPVTLPEKPAVASVAQPQPAVELLRLLRDSHSGQLIVEVGGRRYTKLADIADGKTGQFVLNLAAHYLVFTNGVIMTLAGMKPVYNPKEQAGQVPLPLVTPPLPQAEAAFRPALPAKPVDQPAPPAIKPKGLFGFGRNSAAGGRMPTINLAEEINEIVQHRLRLAPPAEPVRVDITSKPDGGININVNGQVYASPDEISSPEIKELIKQSIKEWERS